MYQVTDLMEFSKQQAAEFLINTVKDKELRLKHPHKDVVTFCRQSKRYRKANVLLFSDSNLKNYWYLFQVYNLVDGYICDDKITNPDGVGEIPQLYELVKQNKFKFDYNCKNTKIDGLLFSQVRPYHYIYDQFINYFHFSKLTQDVLQYCFAGESCFYNELPNGERLQPFKNDGCYLFPCTKDQTYDSQYAEEMCEFLQENVKTKASESDFTLWFGITAQKRSWLEQVKGCVNITKKLLNHYSSITIIIDGWTSLVDDIADSPKDIARDMTVFNSILSQLGGIKNVNVINVIGKSYKEKISYARNINFFIANSGTGSMVPMVFTKSHGVIHTNGRLHTFERLYSKRVRVVPNNKILSQDVSLDSGTYSIEWSVIYNLLIELIGIDAKIPEKVLSKNKYYFDFKRMIFKKKIQIGTIIKKHFNI